MPKQPKPYASFPLTSHPNGQWVKKIRGKVHYFGKDAEAALAKYREEKDDLQAGRQPRRLSSSVSTEYVIQAFLDRSKKRVDVGTLSPLSLADYHKVGKLMAEHLGKTTDPEQLHPDQFTAFRFALKYAPYRLSKVVTVTRGMFKWAFESGLIRKIPNFGPDFKVANKKSIRQHKARQEKKLLTAAELQALLKASDSQWKAILLLCINGGLGNSDIARLKVSDVSGEWLDFPRGKTGIDRRLPLWPETQSALADIAKDRDSNELLFRGKRGGPLITVQESGNRTDSVAIGFKRLATAAKVHRPTMGLYWLRHTFQTVGDGARDPIATSSIMGHVDATMAGNYRESIEDERLLAVVNHVRAWLFKTDDDPADDVANGNHE